VRKIEIGAVFEKSGVMPTKPERYTREEATTIAIEAIAASPHVNSSVDEVRKLLNKTPESAFNLKPEQWHEVTADVAKALRIKLNSEPTEPRDSIDDFLHCALTTLEQSKRIPQVNHVKTKTAKTTPVTSRS
jgi:hypothetical protein